MSYKDDIEEAEGRLPQGLQATELSHEATSAEVDNQPSEGQAESPAAANEMVVDPEDVADDQSAEALCEVGAKLKECRLGGYISTICEKEGFEYLSDLPLDFPDGIEAIAVAAGVKPGHRKRWENFVASVLVAARTLESPSSPLHGKVDTELITSSSPTKEQILAASDGKAPTSAENEGNAPAASGELEALLREYRLDHYVPILTKDLGYEELGDLSFSSADTVEAIAKLIDLKPGHRKRWAAFVTSAARRL